MCYPTHSPLLPSRAQNFASISHSICRSTHSHHVASPRNAAQSSDRRPLSAVRLSACPHVHLCLALRRLAPVKSHYNECRSSSSSDRLSVKIESAFCCPPSLSFFSLLCLRDSEENMHVTVIYYFAFLWPPLSLSLSFSLALVCCLCLCCVCVFLRKASRRIWKIKRFLAHDLDKGAGQRREREERGEGGTCVGGTKNGSLLLFMLIACFVRVSNFGFNFACVALSWHERVALD